MTKQEKQLEQIKRAFEVYYSLHNHYPTTTQIDESGLFPLSVKQMQRIFGGIIQLRNLLNLSTTSFSHGPERAKRALHANNRSVAYTRQFYKQILPIFGESNIHQESPVEGDDYRTRSDFKIYKDNKIFLILDLFYASTLQSLRGCVRIKQKKYHGYNLPVMFVQMNSKVPPPPDLAFTVTTPNGIISTYATLSSVRNLESTSN